MTETPDTPTWPPTVWSDAVAPGGTVCAVPMPSSADGICGYPVESEPCPEHSLNAYVNGDDGYPWLTCNACDEPLRFISAGDTLDELVGVAKNHTCEETADV